MGYVGTINRNQYENSEKTIAERQIEFCYDDCTNETFEIADTMNDSVILVMSEIPVAAYYSCNKNGLNGFINKVNVSIIDGKIGFFDENLDVKEQIIEKQAIVYTQDSLGCCKAIGNDEINEYLLRRPSITISDSGAILFYNSDEIYVTLNCDIANIVSLDEILEEAKIKIDEYSKDFKISNITNDTIEIKYYHLCFEKNGNMKVEEETICINYEVLFDFEPTLVLKVDSDNTEQ